MTGSRPVDVISLCSSEGQIQPLRLRVMDGQEQPIRVDIQEIVSVKEITYVGVEAQVFLCRATVWGKEWLFQLKYSIRNHSWQLLGRLH